MEEVEGRGLPRGRGEGGREARSCCPPSREEPSKMLSREATCDRGAGPHTGESHTAKVNQGQPHSIGGRDRQRERQWERGTDRQRYREGWMIQTEVTQEKKWRYC